MRGARGNINLPRYSLDAPESTNKNSGSAGNGRPLLDWLCRSH